MTRSLLLLVSFRSRFGFRHILNREWHEGIILPLIEGYLSDGKIDSQTAETARQKTKEEHDGLHVGRALIAVLGFV